MAKVSGGWLDTFASLPSEKVAADAVIGGVGGMGLNYAANTSSGDSGGYLGSAAIGAGVGGLARGGLTRMNANKTARMASESAAASAARAERDAVRSANGKDLATGVVDKSVSMFGKAMDRLSNMGAMRSSREASDSAASSVKGMFDALPNMRSAAAMQNAQYSPTQGTQDLARFRASVPDSTPGNSFGASSTSPFSQGNATNDGSVIPGINSVVPGRSPIQNQFKPGARNDSSY